VRGARPCYRRSRASRIGRHDNRGNGDISSEASDVLPSPPAAAGRMTEPRERQGTSVVGGTGPGPRATDRPAVGWPTALRHASSALPSRPSSSGGGRAGSGFPASSDSPK
jgi:hypothetical protein